MHGGLKNVAWTWTLSRLRGAMTATRGRYIEQRPRSLRRYAAQKAPNARVSGTLGHANRRVPGCPPGHMRRQTAGEGDKHGQVCSFELLCVPAAYPPGSAGKRCPAPMCLPNIRCHSFIPAKEGGRLCSGRSRTQHLENVYVSDTTLQIDPALRMLAAMVHT